MRSSQDSRVAKFVAALAAERLDPGLGLKNPYESDTAATNLARYLTVARARGPVVLFVGEAPGYRGATLSGVPFASLATLTTDWNDPWCAFGPTAGFGLPSGSGCVREATATIFWEVVARLLDRLPLPFTWNAVPFHPAAVSGLGNGRPTGAHLVEGRKWLVDFADLVQPQSVVAVGRRAEQALAAVGMESLPVRHPSHGGRTMFSAGVREVAAQLAELAPPPSR